MVGWPRCALREKRTTRTDTVVERLFVSVLALVTTLPFISSARMHVPSTGPLYLDSKVLLHFRKEAED